MGGMVTRFGPYEAGKMVGVGPQDSRFVARDPVTTAREFKRLRGTSRVLARAQ